MYRLRPPTGDMPRLRPGSVAWKVNREGVLVAGGGAALLLQLAHPLVAAGVDQHSDFQKSPIRRLRRTLDAVYDVSFGEPADARAAAERVNKTHRRVHGILRDDTRQLPAGTPYSALDPALLLWVHATLVETARVVYEDLVQPLTRRERAIFYSEMKPVARAFGVPDEEQPPSYADFRRYFDDMIRGPILEVTPTAHRLAEAVLHPPIPLVPRIAGDAGSIITFGLLSPPIRARYGVRWTLAHDLAWRATRTSLRTLVRLLPDSARAVPAARRTERHHRKQRKQRRQ